MIILSISIYPILALLPDTQLRIVTKKRKPYLGPNTTVHQLNIPPFPRAAQPS